MSLPQRGNPRYRSTKGAPKTAKDIKVGRLLNREKVPALDCRVPQRGRRPKGYKPMFLVSRFAGKHQREGPLVYWLLPRRLVSLPLRGKSNICPKGPRRGNVALLCLKAGGARRGGQQHKGLIGSCPFFFLPSGAQRVSQ